MEEKDKQYQQQLDSKEKQLGVKDKQLEMREQYHQQQLADKDKIILALNAGLNNK